MRDNLHLLLILVILIFPLSSKLSSQPFTPCEQKSAPPAPTTSSLPQLHRHSLPKELENGKERSVCVRCNTAGAECRNLPLPIFAPNSFGGGGSFKHVRGHDLGDRAWPWKKAFGLPGASSQRNGTEARASHGGEGEVSSECLSNCNLLILEKVGNFSNPMASVSSSTPASSLCSRPLPMLLLLLRMAWWMAR